MAYRTRCHWDEHKNAKPREVTDPPSPMTWSAAALQAAFPVRPGQMPVEVSRLRGQPSRARRDTCASEATERPGQHLSQLLCGDFVHTPPG